jgi:hypothetical protein
MCTILVAHPTTPTSSSVTNVWTHTDISYHLGKAALSKAHLVGTLCHPVLIYYGSAVHTYVLYVRYRQGSCSVLHNAKESASCSCGCPMCRHTGRLRICHITNTNTQWMHKSCNPTEPCRPQPDNTHKTAVPARHSQRAYCASQMGLCM